MKTKIFILICICAIFTVNLIYARWPSVDPHAENYYPQSPYAFVGGNPINNIEIDGKDWYRNENGDMMWRRMQDKTYTDDNSVVWTNAGTTYLHQRNDGSAIYFSQGTNDDGELTLSSHGLSRNEMSVFGLFHSEKAKMSAIEDHVNPSAGSFAKMMGVEMAAQWTDPYLLTAGATIILGIPQGPNKAALENMAKQKYPKKAIGNDWHHIAPMYMGGAKNGPMIEINSAYHQMITNEFRMYHPYRLGPLSPAERQIIMNKVYSKYPLK